jgi:hypothetical protein
MRPNWRRISTNVSSNQIHLSFSWSKNWLTSHRQIPFQLLPSSTQVWNIFKSILHQQRQRNSKLSQVKWNANVSTKSHGPFLQRQFPVYCQINLLVRFWGSAHSNFMQRNYFPSTWVYCCFNFVRQLPVDCRPIFDSESWGSKWSADYTLFSFWGRSKSKSFICFWQIYHALTEN